jgi:hypothetical protein
MASKKRPTSDGGNKSGEPKSKLSLPAEPQTHKVTVMLPTTKWATQNEWFDDRDVTAAGDSELKDALYVDACKTDDIEWPQVGFPYEYECLRYGEAKVLVDGSAVGHISFVLINRDELRGLNMWEPCDCRSSELEEIASLFFRPDGSLKGALQKQCSFADIGTLMYIETFQLGNDDKAVDPDVASEALRLLIDSDAMANCFLSLVLYIPDGRVDPSGVQRGFDRRLQERDGRPFELTGFKTIRSRNFPLMFKEM